MMLLLEDETVKLPAPKNIYIEDIVISTNAAMFATSKSSIKRRGPDNTSDDRETEMMAARSKLHIVIKVQLNVILDICMKVKLFHHHYT